AFKSGTQEYASDGTPVKAGEEGPWTVYGRMVVEKIEVNADQLKVEGKRAAYSFDRNGTPVKFRDDRKHPTENLSLTLRLQQPLSSTDEAAAVLGRVFALTPKDMVDSVPQYWQPQLASQLGVEGWKKPNPPDVGSLVYLTAKKRTPDLEHISPPEILYKTEPE